MQNDLVRHENIRPSVHLPLLQLKFQSVHYSAHLREITSFLPTTKVHARNSTNYLPEYLWLTSSPPTLVVPSPPPSRRGRQFGTVLPRSTSTSTLLPSIFLPSACLYAAVVEFTSLKYKIGIHMKLICMKNYIK